MKTFEEYLEEELVIKVSPDKQRSENLLLESKRKLNYLDKKLEKLGLDKENCNDYIEDCYNVLMYLIRSKMILKGYNTTGKGAHEAEVSYSKILGLNNIELNKLNDLRYFRNGILYYGKKFDEEYTLKIIKFTKKVFKKIN
ncbi:MAG: hypothetical protein ACMXX7_01155 [Candidatus Woesearchaeota archaeon]